jgi:hypothetical protein
VDGASASSRSWEMVRERALAVESPRARLTGAWRWVRLAPAAAAMSLMVFAVAVAQDSERPAAIQQYNWPTYQPITIEEPDWQMPWWLAAREGPPVVEQSHGPLAKAADDATRVLRAGPFSEFVE